MGFRTGLLVRSTEFPPAFRPDAFRSKSRELEGIENSDFQSEFVPDGICSPPSRGELRWFSLERGQRPWYFG